MAVCRVSLVVAGVDLRLQVSLVTDCSISHPVRAGLDKPSCYWSIDLLIHHEINSRYIHYPRQRLSQKYFIYFKILTLR